MCLPSSNGWFRRGGNYSNGANAGVFEFNYNNGNAGNNESARAVLLQDYNEIPFGNNKIRMKIIFLRRSFCVCSLRMGGSHAAALCIILEHLHFNATMVMLMTITVRARFSFGTTMKYLLVIIKLG